MNPDRNLSLFRKPESGKSCRLSVDMFLLLSLLPSLAMAQTAQLTEQLGRTVLYEDIALSPDGSWVTWVQTTAATSSKALYISSTAPGSRARKVDIGTLGERFDTDPSWSPDSKTLAFFSAPGETNQAQLFTVSSDCSNSRKHTDLKGYAARPRWSHDGKRIAFLYIEGTGGGGPLLAAPAMTGVIENEIHNQRIATARSQAS